MATYYVDPAAAGSNTGADWTNAWTDVQTAFDTAVAGDTVYCRGTQTLAASIDIDTNDGTVSSAITFIGCNASGNVDGTRFVLDGNSAASHCLNFDEKGDYTLIKNFECKNATSHGLDFNGGTTNFPTFFNCSFNNNGGCGVYNVGYGRAPLYIRCVAYSNTDDGFHLDEDNARVLFCRSRNNGQYGFDVKSYEQVYLGCIADNNTKNGFNIDSYSCNFINCVADSNGYGGFETLSTGDTTNLFIGCRSTNHANASYAGMDCQSVQQRIGWCYFEGNSGGNIINSSSAHIITDDSGNSTNLEDQSDINQGYIDISEPENYNLRTDASLRNVAITIPES